MISLIEDWGLQKSFLIKQVTRRVQHVEKDLPTPPEHHLCLEGFELYFLYFVLCVLLFVFWLFFVLDFSVCLSLWYLKSLFLQEWYICKNIMSQWGFRWNYSLKQFCNSWSTVHSVLLFIICLTYFFLFLPLPKSESSNYIQLFHLWAYFIKFELADSLISVYFQKLTV